MGKSVVIFHVFLILAQNFNISAESILKLSALIEHAHYHKDNYGDNFITFLSEHYGNLTTTHENQHTEHKDLPFKDHHPHILCHTNVLFLFIHNNDYILIRHFFEKQSKNFYYQELFSSFEKPPFFQPPKIA